MTDYYKILQIEKNATDDDIKIAYRSLAKIHHPDKGGDKEKFQQIQTAYETLSHPQKRHEYDMSNSSGENSNAFNFFNNFMNININPMFNQNNGGVVKKQNSIHIWKITLNDVRNGKTQNFNLRRKKICEECKIICGNCAGSGISNQRQTVQIGPLIQFINNPCGNCKSKGFIRKTGQCSPCNSTGFLIIEKSVDLIVPKCVENGKQYIFENMGQEAERHNEIAGDQIIQIEIEQDDLLERINTIDLLYQVEISIFDTISGRMIYIPYFDEPFEKDISEWCVINPETEYRIYGKGLETSENIKGDLIIKFKIRYPKLLLTKVETDRFKQLFQNM